MHAAAREQLESRPPRGRRRQYLVNAAFQWKYAIFVVVIVFCLTVFLTSVLFGVLFDEARSRVLYYSDPTAAGAPQPTVTFLGAALGFSALVSLAFGIWSVFVTHRICGPLSVIQHQIMDLAYGRFPRKRPLRKTDEFKDFYDRFWRAVEVLRAQKQSDLHELAEAIALARAACDAHPDERRRALDSVAALLEAMRERVAEQLGEAPAPAAAMPDTQEHAERDASPTLHEACI